jgi:cysteinyl-tRNA synthetase
MSAKHLGNVFDIHGGGIDLLFPHHENEVAQSTCAHGTEIMANVWMHNGHLQVEGQKMSKSLGNFITIHDLLSTKNFGNQPWHGKVVRFAMLGAHYRQPMDWTVDRLAQARSALRDWAGFVHGAPTDEELDSEVLGALEDDLNTPAVIAILHGLGKHGASNPGDIKRLATALRFLGLYDNEGKTDFDVGYEAKEASVDSAKVESLKNARLAARKAKDWAEADRIRDELVAMGIILMDAKNPITGEIETTWKIAR